MSTYNQGYYNSIADGVTEEFIEELKSSKGGSSANWAIRGKDIFSSCLEKYEKDTTPILGYNRSSFRIVSCNSSGERGGNQKIELQPLCIAMLVGSWMPILANLAIKGAVSASLEIIKFTSNGANNQIEESILCADCVLTALIHRPIRFDTLFFFFIYRALTLTTTTYNSKGIKEGQNSALIDISSGVTR